MNAECMQVNEIPVLTIIELSYNSCKPYISLQEGTNTAIFVAICIEPRCVYGCVSCLTSLAVVCTKCCACTPCTACRRPCIHPDVLLMSTVYIPKLRSMTRITRNTLIMMASEFRRGAATVSLRLESLIGST